MYRKPIRSPVHKSHPREKLHARTLPHPNKQTVIPKKPSVTISFAVICTGFQPVHTVSFWMLLRVWERKKHHPPQVMARIHFCAIWVSVEKAPKNPRERNFMARLNQERLMILTDSLDRHKEIWKSRISTEGRNKQQKAASAFTWLVASAVEEKLSDSLLHH